MTNDREKWVEVNKMMKALDVANYIVDFVSRSHPDEKLTHVKLQKIIYYSYATFLKEKGLSLFPEKIEKWQYGPVVRSVYDQFKSFGYSHISSPKTELIMSVEATGAVKFEYKKFDDSVIQQIPGANETIDKVVSSLISHDAFDLVEMTHQEDSWKKFESLILKREPNLFYTNEEILNCSKKVV
ncbi:hypothetical protein MF4640_14670 [Acinetobacter sp. MF4640]|nr:hypothetical protein MF4640_14670 [Acinetobacter sp. MF4640]